MHSQNLFDLSVGYMNSHLLTSDAVSPAFRHLNGLPRKETKQSATVQHRVRVSLTRRIISITRPHCRFCRPQFFVALSELNHPLFLPLSFFWGVARSLLAASKVTPKRAAAAARFKPYGHVQKGGQTDMLGQHWGVCEEVLLRCGYFWVIRNCASLRQRGKHAEQRNQKARDFTHSLNHKSTLLSIILYYFFQTGKSIGFSPTIDI